MLDHLDIANALVRFNTAQVGDEKFVGPLLTDRQTLVSAGLQLPDPANQASWHWALSTLVSSGRLLVIIEQQTGQTAGIISLTPVDDQHIEIGYLLAPSFRGRGLMTNALQLLTGVVSNEDQQLTLLATTTLDNQASINVLKRVGFNPVMDQSGTIINWQW